MSLLDALSEGMHTVAQPLTVLRATLEIAAGNACSVSQFQHAVDTSLVEVTRVSEAMRFVQELVRIARGDSEAVPVELAPVIAGVQEDLQCYFDTAQVSMKVHLLDGAEYVLASPVRLRECVFYLVQHAVTACGRQGTIHLDSRLSDGEVCVYLHVAADQDAPAAIDVERSLNWNGLVPCLALAETLARADGGRLEAQSDPFHVRLWLPFPVRRKGVRSSSEASVNQVLMNGTDGELLKASKPTP